MDIGSVILTLELGLENDSPSRGRKLVTARALLIESRRLENDSPSRGRKPRLHESMLSVFEMV